MKVNNSGQTVFGNVNNKWRNVSLWSDGPQMDDTIRLLVQPEIRAKNAFGAFVLSRFQCTFGVSGGDLSFLGLKEY